MTNWWISGVGLIMKRLVMGTLITVFLILFFGEFFTLWATVSTIVFVGGIFSFRRNWLIAWLVMAGTILILVTLLFSDVSVNWFMFFNLNFWFSGLYILIMVIAADLVSRAFFGFIMPDEEDQMYREEESWE